MITFMIHAVFVFSVVFIWLMLLYQFVLCLGGFFYRSRIAREESLPVEPDRLPVVSILIPARNEEKVIGKLLERIAEFEYPAAKIEVLVVDDGSSDRTGEIVAEFGRRDPRFGMISVPAEKSGRGKSAALNLTVKQAAGEVIAVYDADNIPDKDSLVRLCAALGRDKRLAAVCGKFRAYNKGRNILTRLINLEGIAFQWLIQAGRNFFLGLCFIPGTNFVIRKSVLTELGGWDEQALTEDSELTFRIYEKGYRIKFLPTATTWEQEPERLSTWIRQRTRWARGNNYIISKNLRTVFKTRPKLTTFELLNLFYLYYFFIFAILFSDILFILSLTGVVHIRVIGPYAELWALAFLLYLLEVLIALAFEREDTFGNFFVACLAYVTYTKLWVWVVLKSLYLDYIRKSSRTWAKTERFNIEP